VALVNLAVRETQTARSKPGVRPNIDGVDPYYDVAGQVEPEKQQCKGVAKRDKDRGVDQVLAAREYQPRLTGPKASDISLLWGNGVQTAAIGKAVAWPSGITQAAAG
jgi:hypothetical protein